MQAVSSIWPLKGHFLEVPPLSFQLGSTPFGFVRRCRKINMEFDELVVSVGKPDFLFASRYVARNRSQEHSRSSQVRLGIRCFFGKIVLPGGRNSSLGMCLPMGWALEEQAIGGDVNEENAEHNSKFSEETQAGDTDPLEPNDLQKGELQLRKIGNSDDTVGKLRGKKILEADKTTQVDVRGLTQSLQLAQSVEDVEEVLKGMNKLPLRVFSSIIRTFGREKRLEPAMAVVNWLKKKHKENQYFDGPNLFIYNSLLGAVKQSGQHDKVETVMNAIDEAGIPPNVVTYNTLMGIYLDEGRAADALDTFEDIQRKGLSPTPASYSTALLAYRRMENGFGALSLFVAVREKYVRGELQKNADEDWENEFLKLKDFTSRICYQVMRRWLVEEGKFATNVLKLLIEMDKANLAPTRSEYERLIWACTREEHYTVGRELYNRIRERHSDISLSVCNHIIWLMGKAKKWWAALEIYEDLLDKGPKPNNLSYELVVSHFNVLLSAARKRGFWSWGIRLLDKMEAKGLKPRSREWNSVLIACSKASESTAAVKIFQRMVERGEKPTEVSYGALLSALEKGKMYDEAVRVWEHMLKVGIQPNLYSYTIMASVYVGLGKFHLVDYIITEMVSTGNTPTVITFNAIISVCARSDLGGAAYEWFQRMKDMSIEPNEITYQTLIEALAKDGKPRLAYDLFLRALNEGLNLSSRAYDAVIQSSRTFGATIDLSALGPRPSEKKKMLLTGKNSESCNVADASSRGEPVDKENIYTQQVGKDM